MKRAYVLIELQRLEEEDHGDFEPFLSNYATIPLPFYKKILKHRENEINQFLKEEQIVVSFSPFWRQKCVNLKKLGYFFQRLQFIQTQSQGRNEFFFIIVPIFSQNNFDP